MKLFLFQAQKLLEEKYFFLDHFLFIIIFFTGKPFWKDSSGNDSQFGSWFKAGQWWWGSFWQWNKFFKRYKEIWHFVSLWKVLFHKWESLKWRYLQKKLNRSVGIFLLKLVKVVLSKLCMYLASQALKKIKVG